MKKILVLMLVMIIIIPSGCSLLRRSRQGMELFKKLTADDVFQEWSERGSRVRSLEASLQTEVNGVSLPLRGQLFGSIRLEQGLVQDYSSPAVHILAYTLFGAPGFEYISRGDQFELFVPGEKRVYLNVIELAQEQPESKLSIQGFNESFFPPGLLKEFLELLWGRRLRTERTYSMEDLGDSFTLTEYEQETVTLVAKVLRQGLTIEELKLFNEGQPWAEIMLTAQDTFSDEAGWIPKRIEIRQGERVLVLKLSDIQTRAAFLDPPITFRPPETFETVWVGEN